VALLLALVLVADARAGLMTPPGLAPGDQFRIVFVTPFTTAGSTPATSSALATYDAVAQIAAQAAGLGTYAGSPVLWEAIVSTSAANSAISRLPADTVPLYLPDGTKVAPSGAALWNTTTTPLLHAINETPSGGLSSGMAWTGTDSTGVADAVPLGSAGGVSILGFVNQTSNAWVFGSAGLTSAAEPVYGFSNVLTVPQAAAAVPVPATLTLMLVGLGGLLGARLAQHRRAAASGPSACPPTHS
jgi:hypothetical protein